VTSKACDVVQSVGGASRNQLRDEYIAEHCDLEIAIYGKSRKLSTPYAESGGDGSRNALRPLPGKPDPESPPRNP
jgi:hypothetical protein